MIEAHNLESNTLGWKMAMNEFMDVHPDEFKAHVSTVKFLKLQPPNTSPSSIKTPTPFHPLQYMGY